MDWKGVTVTPRRGTTFGCTRRFHTTASRQKSYVFYQERERKGGNIDNLHVLHPLVPPQSKPEGV